MDDSIVMVYSLDNSSRLLQLNCGENTCDNYQNRCAEIDNTVSYYAGKQSNGYCAQRNQNYASKFNQKKNYQNQFFNQGISMCASQHCIQNNTFYSWNGTAYNPYILYACVKLLPNVWVGYDSNHYCLKEGNGNAVQCVKGQYCLDQASKSCMHLSSNITENRFARQANTDSCISQQIATLIGDNLEQCLRGFCVYTDPDTGIQKCLEVGIKYQYCADQEGKCVFIYANLCSYCPDGYCQFNDNQGYCIYGKELIQKLGQKNCAVKVNNDGLCQILNINSQKYFTYDVCTDINGFCQNVQDRTKQCQQCPQNYKNPGNQTCFSIEQTQQFLQTKLVFNMNLDYVQDDCYDQNFCKSNQQFKCPLGCFSCNSQFNCTQCQKGFFMSRNSQSNYNQCIQCPQIMDFVWPRGQCIDCSSELDLWQFLQSNLQIKISQIFLHRNYNQEIKTCRNFESQYYYIGLQKRYDRAQNFQVFTNQNYQYVQNLFNCKLFDFYIYFYSYTFVQGPQNCASCYYQGLNAICLSCIQSFVLQSLNCVPCPQNCTKCDFAIFVTGKKALLKSSLTQKQLSSGQYANLVWTLICLQCPQRQLIRYDLLGCEDCGQNCNECVYQNIYGIINDKESNLVQMTQQDIVNLGYKKACQSCYQGVVDGSGQNCTLFTYDIPKCQSYAYLINDSIYQHIQPLYFLYGQVTKFTLICNLCQNGYQQTADKKNCTQSNNSVNFCYSSIFDNDSRSCINQYCSLVIYNCYECFTYKAQYGSDIIQIYQCTRCAQGFVPTLKGCLPCPEGCLDCYEGSKFEIWTNDLAQNRYLFSYQDHLNYIYGSNLQILCRQCSNGYYLDKNTQQCIKLSCGKFCSSCYFDYNKKKPVCQLCNQDALSNLIKDQLYWIARLYFNSNQLPNIQQLFKHTDDEADCMICPLLCSTCYNVGDISKNPYFLYQSQCMSCIDNTYGFSSSISDYQITYDKSRRKCYLCNKNNQGCHYQKQKVIYAQCSNIGKPLGDGSLQNPINFNRIKDINIDQIILNELPFDQMVVYYNELQVREINVNIIFLNDFCEQQNSFQLSSQLGQKIFSLESLTLNITSQNFHNQQKFNLTQTQILQISGFNSVFISGIDFIQQKAFSNFGISIYSQKLLQVGFDFVSFKQISVQKDATYFYLQFAQIQNTTIAIQNCYFQNIILLNQQSLITLDQFLSQQQSINLTLFNTTFEKVYIQESMLIRFNMQYIQFFLQGVNIINSNILSSQMFIFASPSLTDNIKNIQIKSFNLSKTNFTGQSEIILDNNINSLILQQITISYCQFTLDQIQNYLIVSNIIQTDQIVMSNNQINNYGLFSLISNKQSQLQSQAYLMNIEFSNNQVSGKQSFLFQNDGINVNNSITITKIIVKDNQILNLRNNLIQIKSAMSVNLYGINLKDNINLQFIYITNTNNISIDTLDYTQSDEQFISQGIISIKYAYNSISIKNINVRNLNAVQIPININLLFSINQISNTVVTIQNLNLRNITLTSSKQATSMSFLQISSDLSSQISIKDVQYQIANFQSTISYASLQQISIFLNVKALVSSVILENAVFYNISPLLIAPLLNINTQMTIFKLISVYFNKFNLQNIQQDNQYKLGGTAYIQSVNTQIISSNITNSQATQGAGIYLVIVDYGNVLIKQCNFTNNISFMESNFESLGGGIYFDGKQSYGFDINIISSYFIQNVATFRGGAIYLQTPFHYGCFLGVQSSYFINNFSLQGSQLFVQGNLQDQTKFEMNTIQTLNIIPELLQQMTFLKALLLKNKQYEYLLPSNIQVTNIKYFQLESSNFSIQIGQPNLINKEQIIFQSILQVDSLNKFDCFLTTFENSIYENTLISLNKINKTLFEYVTIQNNTNYYDYLRANQDSVNQNTANLLQIFSQSVYLIYSNFTDNKCSVCKTGNILINSVQTHLSYNLFKKNIALNGGSLYISSQKGDSITQNIQSKHNSRFLQQIDQNNSSLLIFESYTFISRCSFEENQSIQNGGAVYLSQFPVIIQKSIFIENTALLNGGAIFCRDEQNSYFESINSLYKSNVALNGGAVFSVQGNSLRSQNTNIFFQNQASILNKDIFISPIQMKILINKVQNDNNKPKILVSDHISGYLEQEIVISLANSQGDVYKNIEQSEILQIKKISGEGYLSTNTLTQINGVYNFTQQVQIQGNLGTNLTLQIYSNSIKVPVFDQFTGNVKYNRGQSVFIQINMIKKCPLGYVLKKSNLNYDICILCKGSYSIDPDSQVCTPCPVQKAICYGSFIQLPQGYWRYSQNSSLYYQCETDFIKCVGDNSTLFQQVSQYKQQNTYDVYYCNRGYIGALCGDCDIKQMYWDSKFYKTSYNSCKQCRNNLAINVLIIVCLFIVYLILLYYYSYKIFEGAQQILKVKILKLFSQNFVSNGQQSKVNQIKIILSNLQIFTSVINLNIQDDVTMYFVNFFKFPFILPVDELACYLDKNIGFLTIPFLKLSYYFIVCILMIMGCFAIQMLLCIKQQNKQRFQPFLNSAFILLYFNLPLFLKIGLGVMTCQNYDGKMYISDYLSLSCDQTFKIISLSIGLPLLLIIITSFILILAVIRKNLPYLQQYKFQKHFGFFYSQYTEECYYWDLLVLLLKCSITAIIQLAKDNQNLKQIILCMILTIYTIFTKKNKPFQDNRINRLDFFISYLLIFVPCFNLIIQNSDSNLTTTFFQNALIVLYVLVALLNLIIYSYYFLQKKNSTIYKILLKIYQILNNIIFKKKKISLQYDRSYRNWILLKLVLTNYFQNQQQKAYIEINNQNLQNLKNIFIKQQVKLQTLIQTKIQ
ncbi:hypothetical protein ABPG74_008828 [Tetrahymena malaccensis]